MSQHEERRSGLLQISEDELKKMLHDAAKAGAAEVINTFGERFTYKAGAWFLDKITFILGAILIGLYVWAKKHGLID